MSAPGIKEPSRPGWATGFQGPTLQPHRPHHHHQPPWAAVNQCSTPPPPTCTHKLPNPAPLLQGTILSHPPPAPPTPKHGPHVNRATAPRLPPPTHCSHKWGGGHTSRGQRQARLLKKAFVPPPTHPPSQPQTLGQTHRSGTRAGADKRHKCTPGGGGLGVPSHSPRQSRMRGPREARRTVATPRGPRGYPLQPAPARPPVRPLVPALPCPRRRPTSLPRPRLSPRRRRRRRTSRTGPREGPGRGCGPPWKGGLEPRRPARTRPPREATPARPTPPTPLEPRAGPTLAGRPDGWERSAAAGSRIPDPRSRISSTSCLWFMATPGMGGGGGGSPRLEGGLRERKAAGQPRFGDGPRSQAPWR